MSDSTKEPLDGGAPGQTTEGQAAAAFLDDLETLRQERDKFLDLLQRTQADFQNYQKRNQREREQERRYWHGPLGLELLPVIDNLERALAAANQANESGPLVQGVHMVLRQFLDLLQRHGISEIEAAGQSFDPNRHQAVMQQPTDEVPPGTVTQVLERGFTIHDRVLRPAKVVVSVAPNS